MLVFLNMFKEELFVRLVMVNKRNNVKRNGIEDYLNSVGSISYFLSL